MLLCTHAGDGITAHCQGRAYIHPFCSHLDRAADASGPCAYLQLPAEVLPRLLPLAVHDPPPGADDQVLPCFLIFQSLNVRPLGTAVGGGPGAGAAILDRKGAGMI